MASSPRTPMHSRGPSNNGDLSFITPLSYNSSRRQSKVSIHTPTSPNRHSFTRSDSTNDNVFSSGGPAIAANGLGNLADELADMEWGDEEGEDIDDEESELDIGFQEAIEREKDMGDLQKDSEVDVTTPVNLNSVERTTKNTNLTPPVMSNGRGHKRQPSEYDGSDYGDDSDLESSGIPVGLVARMDMVESLVRRGTEDNGTEMDGVVKRVVEQLKDLGGQAGVEGGATRLITANTALSTHLLHQARLIQSLTYPLFSPLSLPPDEEFIDDLMPFLLTISDTMPRPSPTALASISQLSTLTTDLVQTLNYLSDTLHMSRQTTTTATRRLRSARELVAEMKKEEAEREEGEIWLERYNWSERLENRECAALCRDVVGGFEEVCNGWRARLVAQAETVAA